MSNDTVPSEYALTSEQVQAIRKLVARKGSWPLDKWIRVVYESDRGAHVDVLDRQRFSDAVEGRNEVLHEIVLPARSRFVHYRDGDRVRVGEETGPVRCVATETHYEHSGHDGYASSLASLANTVRAGDELVVRFIIGNSTETLRKACLSQDEAYFSVVRKGKVFATFAVDFRVTLIGSWGGMVDRTYRPSPEYSLTVTS